MYGRCMPWSSIRSASRLPVPPPHSHRFVERLLCCTVRSEHLFIIHFSFRSSPSGSNGTKQRGKNYFALFAYGNLQLVDFDGRQQRWCVVRGACHQAGIDVCRGIHSLCTAILRFPFYCLLSCHLVISLFNHFWKLFGSFSFLALLLLRQWQIRWRWHCVRFKKAYYCMVAGRVALRMLPLKWKMKRILSHTRVKRGTQPLSQPRRYSANGVQKLINSENDYLLLIRLEKNWTTARCFSMAQRHSSIHTHTLKCQQMYAPCAHNSEKVLAETGSPRVK